MSKITRRKFLENSTLASGAAVTAGSGVVSATSTSLQSSLNSASDRIHVALIGSGGMGRANLRDFLRIEQVDCPAVADVDEEHLQQGVALLQEERGKRPDGYRDFRRILDREDIDAVIVATPDHWHALPTILAWQSGKDVYVEKPLATSLEEGRAMVEAPENITESLRRGPSSVPRSITPGPSSLRSRANWAQSGRSGLGPIWTGKEVSAILPTRSLWPQSITISGWGRRPNDPFIRFVFTLAFAGSGTIRAVS